MDIGCDSNHCLIFVEAKRSKNDSQQTSKRISGESLAPVIVYLRIVQSSVWIPLFSSPILAGETDRDDENLTEVRSYGL
jgi:hypothetical protein